MNDMDGFEILLDLKRAIEVRKAINEFIADGGQRILSSQEHRFKISQHWGMGYEVFIDSYIVGVMQDFEKEVYPEALENDAKDRKIDELLEKMTPGYRKI